MELVGEQKINAPQPDVWRALNDPEVLKNCIPGCESIERVGGDEFKIVMLAAVGPVKARFNGALAIRNAIAPSSYDLVFEGSGGVAGFGKGTASVSLLPEADGTLLRYEAKAQVGGRLAQVGSRLIDGVARKMALDFFGRFDRQFAQAPAGAVAGAAVATAPLPTPAAVAPKPATPAPLSTPVAGSLAASADAAAIAAPLRVIAAGTLVAAAALVGIFLKLLAM